MISCCKFVQGFDDRRDLTICVLIARMDVNMPNMDGITSTKKIIELMPDRNSR